MQNYSYLRIYDGFLLGLRMRWALLVETHIPGADVLVMEDISNWNSIAHSNSLINTLTEAKSWLFSLLNNAKY